MKYYRLNQIAMAVLGALLLFFGARTLIHIMFEEPEEKPGYEVPGTKAEKPTEQKPSEAAQLATLLAKADPAKGADVAKKCEICHNFEKGGPNMIGPNLYGVLGRKVASHEGYDYSDALKAKAAEIGTWGYDSVSEMDANPSAFVPGTKMALFQGLPDIKERADLLAFMRTKNDNPPPLPEVKETPKPGGETTPPAAPAAGGNEFMAALAKADPKAGEADTALCKVCHTFNKGGATLVGPNLYGVVGRKIASEDGFNYTPGLKAHEADWTFDKLNEWLTNPAAFAPGTMMAFPGIPDVKKRADVIAYLNSNSDSPLPIPKPGAGGAEGEKGAAAPAAAPMTPPAAAPEAAPAAPAAPAPAAAPEAAPAAPAAPAPEAAPKAETPPAPTPEAAPPAETKPAPEGAPSAETPPAPAPSAETPPAPAPEAAPSAETPPAPAPEAAPSAETPPAPAPEAAPPTEENQSVHPNGAPEAQSETPSSPATEAEPSGEDSTLSNQPQPVYPNGAPDAQ